MEHEIINAKKLAAENDPLPFDYVSLAITTYFLGACPE